MKIIIVFLTAFCSIFLESSTAPAPLLGLRKITGVLGDVVERAGDDASGLIRNIGTFTDNTVEHVTGKIVNDVKTTIGKVGKTVKDVKSEVQAEENYAEDSLKQLVYKRIKSSEEILAKVIKTVNAALSKASDEHREGLTQVIDWLKSFKSIVTTLHDKLKKVVNGGSQAARDEVVADLIKAIEETKATLASFKNIPDVTKEVLVKGVEQMLANAADEVEDLKTASLQQITYKRIKSSEEILAKVIKTVKAALAKASDEHREGLTQVIDWLKSFKSIVTTLHAKLIKVVNGGSQAARDEVVADVIKAIEETKATLASFKNIPDVTKEVLVKGVEQMLANAADEVEDLKTASLQQVTYKRIKSSEEILAKVIKTVKTALAKASDEHREGLTQVIDWLKSFKSIVTTLHDKLKKVVNGGSQAARDEVVADLIKAIEETKATLASFKNIPDVTKEVLVKGVEQMLANAADEVEDLKTASLQQITYKRIKSSEGILAKVIKTVKAALAKASDEHREGLTQVIDWLKSFKSIVTTLHAKLIKVVNGGSQAARDEVVADVIKAIEETKATLASFKNIPDVTKEVLVKGVEQMLANAADEVEDLKTASLQQITYKRIKSSEGILAKVIKTVKAALAKASDEHREGLTQVIDWLKSFKSIVTTLHAKLIKVVNGGSQAARDEVVADVVKAIEETKATLASFKNIPDVTKEVLVKGVEQMLANAADEVEDLKSASSTDSLKQLVDDRIKISDEALAKVIKAVKAALASASNEDKESLTQMSDWLKSFECLVATVHDKLKSVVDDGCEEAREEVIAQMETAIEETKAELASFTNIPEDVSASWNKGIGTIIANAVDVLEALVNSP